VEVTLPVAVALLAAAAAPAPAPAPADEPPVVEHQQVPCTVPDRPFTLCTAVRDDGDVAKVRVFFRPEGDRHFMTAEMGFDGIRYCGTLPAPRQGKLKSLEYYVEAIDTTFNASRTSKYRMLIQTDSVCSFPPVEKDPARLSAIVVSATHPSQGRRLPGEFLDSGVSFVPARGR
jgi:hypothetical protein